MLVGHCRQTIQRVNELLEHHRRPAKKKNETTINDEVSFLTMMIHPSIRVVHTSEEQCCPVFFYKTTTNLIFNKMINHLAGGNSKVSKHSLKIIALPTTQSLPSTLVNLTTQIIRTKGNKNISLWFKTVLNKRVWPLMLPLWPMAQQSSAANHTPVTFVYVCGCMYAPNEVNKNAVKC